MEKICKNCKNWVRGRDFKDVKPFRECRSKKTDKGFDDDETSIPKFPHDELIVHIGEAVGWKILTGPLFRVESQGVQDEDEFDPSTNESEMNHIEIFVLPDQHVKRIGYK